MGRLIGIETDIGNKRTFNEDSVGYYEGDDISVYIVADGMGGHNAGEVASRMAKDIVIDYVVSHQEASDMKETLKEAINSANLKIYKESIINDDCKGMGTTMVVALVRGCDLIIANIGDSRAYILNDNGLTKVTRDHSLVQELLDNGTITGEEARNHPNKNVITRAVGTNTSVEADYYNLDVREISRVILCSDGLTNEVSEEEILHVMMEDESEQCMQLISRSKENGGRDNVSVIIFKGECEVR